MVYRAVGITSGNALEGLDISFVEFEEVGGKWTYSIKAGACFPYSPEWHKQLQNAANSSAWEYQQLHHSFGQLIGSCVNEFIESNNLQYQVQLLCSHGHTIFHDNAKHISAQLGHGGVIAATTGINVVTDLRSIDMVLGGKGTPISPVGEKLLLGDYNLFLNLGAVAGIALQYNVEYQLYDICPCNRILNLLAEKAGKRFDDGGQLAAAGSVDTRALEMVNQLEYYALPQPKSLAYDFAPDVLFPLLKNAGGSASNALRTATEHIIEQIGLAVDGLIASASLPTDGSIKMLITGGGANNNFLAQRLQEMIESKGITTVVPDKELLEYKDSLVAALLGILRWREENNVLASVTGATRNSIGGAVWMGLEA